MKQRPVQGMGKGIIKIVQTSFLMPYKRMFEERVDCRLGLAMWCGCLGLLASAVIADT